MGDKVYLAMAGAAARLRTLDAIADNLANAETPGFRAAQGRFESYLADPGQRAAEHPSYVAAMAGGVDQRSGAPELTGRPLDVRVDGRAFLAVQLPNGAPGYTRDGRIDVDTEGMLHIQGRPVLGQGGEPIIAPRGARVAIDERGAVSADGVEIDRLGLHELSGALERVGPAVLAPGVDGVAVPVEGRLAVGEIEGSNVTALESTVALVTAQRAYDNALQALQTSKRLDERAAEVGRVRG